MSCNMKVRLGGTIDISWLDWAYKSSTCDAMYRRQRRIYIGGTYNLIQNAPEATSFRVKHVVFRKP
jgi:hypothetical protein